MVAKQVLSKIRPTPLYKYYIQRAPLWGVWATGLGAFLGWPHVWIMLSNKIDDVPPINFNHL
ncbi:hypothetical protein G9P44_000485 [Scheffersomyces stipitis]|nr:hypothetical protein G9P44_000485 [Scheffersomyces stipitis]